MSIREMKESDLPQVLALQQELSFQDWNEKQFLAEIRASYALCVVYETDSFNEASANKANENSVAEKSIAGYAVFHLMGPDSELLSIATARNMQRNGIGTALLQAGCSHLDFAAGDKMFLEVREGNTKARNFYEKHGFEAFSNRASYYSDGENAILYSKTR